MSNNIEVNIDESNSGQTSDNLRTDSGQETQDVTLEALAKKHGWDPEKGEKSAADFIEFALENFPKRGDALSAKKKQLRAKDSELVELRVAVDQLARDMKKSKEIAQKQALQELEMQRASAIKSGDVDLVNQLDSAKNDLMQEKHVIEQQELVNDFFARNSDWMQSTDFEALEMQAYANQIDQALIAKKLPPMEHLQRIEDAVKHKFASFFAEEEAPINKTSVEAIPEQQNVMTSKKSKSFSLRDLNDAQRAVAKHLTNSGVMTADEYIKKLVENGDLK